MCSRSAADTSWLVEVDGSTSGSMLLLSSVLALESARTRARSAHSGSRGTSALGFSRILGMKGASELSIRSSNDSCGLPPEATGMSVSSDSLSMSITAPDSRANLESPPAVVILDDDDDGDDDE